MKVERLCDWMLIWIHLVRVFLDSTTAVCFLSQIRSTLISSIYFLWRRKKQNMVNVVSSWLTDLNFTSFSTIWWLSPQRHSGRPRWSLWWRPRAALPAGGGSAMNQSEDREEGAPPSKTTLCGQHESQTRAQRWDEDLELSMTLLHVRAQHSDHCSIIIHTHWHLWFLLLSFFSGCFVVCSCFLMELNQHVEIWLMIMTETILFISITHYNTQYNNKVLHMNKMENIQTN